MTIQVQGLDHVAIAAGEQATTASWYRDLLGLERMYADAWGDTPIALMSEGSGMAVFQAGESRSAGFRHIAFRVDRENFDRARMELPAKGVPVEFQDHGVSHSIYFQDPDGVELELTTYEL